MSSNRTNPKVDAFVAEATAWKKEIAALRKIALGCGLEEQFKWGKPCYAHGQRNVAIVIPLKESCAFMFPQGALLKDPKHMLSRVGENTQGSRWIKFTSASEIVRRAAALKALVREAIAAEKAGLKVRYKPTSEFPVAEELKAKFGTDPAFKAAFAALTPGRQRGYLLFFSGAKQSSTRAARIEKSAPLIFQGKGLYD